MTQEMIDRVTQYTANLSDQDLTNLKTFVAMNPVPKLQALLVAAAKSGNAKSVEFTEVAITFRKLVDMKAVKL